MNRSNSSKVFSHAFFDLARQARPDCRLRFAPTPSGYLHPGNALNFTLNWLVARLRGGRILLRIDDLDADRKRPEYVLDIFDSLRWLGLDWDEGPGLDGSIDPLTDFEKNWSQHRRLSQYHQLLEALRRQNRLFACRKSRSELSAYGGAYPLEFRQQNLSLDDQDVAWRIKSDTAGITDFVVRRRDGIPAYQIACVADDLHFGITHVIRGADLEASTAAQRWIARQLDLEGFLNIQFLHHPLLLDAQGAKLSKSAGASSLKMMRERGESPSKVFEQASGLLGLPVVDTAAALLAEARVVSLQ